MDIPVFSYMPRPESRGHPQRYGILHDHPIWTKFENTVVAKSAL